VIDRGALVTKSVAPGTSVVGNPARVMEPHAK
jgi:acetyltransferase-like isoleucine patch superfamily enzyme